MPLSWNEIRGRATAFAKEWKDASDEDADAKSFWDGLFTVYGVPRRRFATFETRVAKGDGSRGFIDLLWKKVVLVEHKSRGKSLDQAHEQAKEYFPGIKDSDLPRYIVVSDFERFRVTDLETGSVNEFKLKDLPHRIQTLGFIAGYQAHVFKEQDPVNIRAAEKLGALHDELKAIGYEGHELEVFLVRLLFCLFADDTGIFVPRDIFQDYIELRTHEDGSDLGPRLQELFETLNRPIEKRYKNLDEALQQFPYANGALFKESLPIAPFTSKTRSVLLDCCTMDWGQISPAIFGSLFQSIMNTQERRHLGAHYTSETNILKAIGPLFLDALKVEFEQIKTQPAKLRAFHEKLSKLNFFDPACGCGNFLVIAYREIRLIELEVIRILYSKSQQMALDVINHFVKVDVDQFHGIEIDEWPAQIARVAMWLLDHQMNVKLSQDFGEPFVRVPLVKTANIVHGNALILDWSSVIAPAKCSYIIGNPPFKGAKNLSDEQRRDVDFVLDGIESAGVLDLVSAWYVKAARYMTSAPANARPTTALVSTNSITQGEQVAVLWTWLLAYGVHIHFAHRTFQWSNEARGNAAVHCVIIGFGIDEAQTKTLFEYASIRGAPHAIKATNINPYLVDAKNLLVMGRTTTICEAPAIVNGSIPADGGNLILSPEERKELLANQPEARPFIRRYLGADDFISDKVRYCLWLVDCPPELLRKMPLVMARIKAVKVMREKSPKDATVAKAATASLFTENRQPVSGTYLAIPRTSSEFRMAIPIGFMSHTNIAANDLQIVPNAGLFHFGVLSSAMHTAWARTTSGRLKSDIRYSTKYTYNTFPWPDATDAQKQTIELAAQAVLDQRKQSPKATLADLYDELSMPPGLVQAHKALDKAVDAAYAKRKFTSDANRMVHLLAMYEGLVGAIMSSSATKKTRARKAAT